MKSWGSSWNEGWVRIRVRVVLGLGVESGLGLGVELVEVSDGVNSYL